MGPGTGAYLARYQCHLRVSAVHSSCNQICGEKQLPIRKNAYMAEVVMQQLGETFERTGDILKKERVRNVPQRAASAMVPPVARWWTPT